MFENVEWWQVILFFLVISFLVIAIRVNSEFSMYYSADDIDDDDDDETLHREFVARIKAVKDKNELLDIANECNEDDEYLGDEANDEFLAKALHFDLSKYDWEIVYRAAESGTELERIAEERAGSALE